MGKALRSTVTIGGEPNKFFELMSTVIENACIRMARKATGSQTEKPITLKQFEIESRVEPVLLFDTFRVEELVW